MTRTDAKKNPHHIHFVELVRVVEGEVHSEQSLEFPLVRIDASVHFETPDPFWGVLRGRLEQRYVAMEHVSSRITRVDWLVWELEAAALTRLWHLKQLRGQRRPLLLAILDCRLPAWARRRLREVEPGLFTLRVDPGFEVIAVVLPLFPLRKGTSGLHMLRLPSKDGSAHAARVFVEDESILPSVRRRVLESIMNHNPTLSKSDQWLTVEAVLAVGEARGEAKGARELALALARDLLGEVAAERLAALDDVDAIRAAIVSAVKR